MFYSSRTFTATNDKPEISQKEDYFAKCIVKQINRIITNNLTDKVEHVITSQVSIQLVIYDIYPLSALVMN